MTVGTPGLSVTGNDQSKFLITSDTSSHFYSAPAKWLLLKLNHLADFFLLDGKHEAMTRRHYRGL